VPADLLDEVQERAMSRLPELATELLKRMHRPDGTTVGDAPLSRGERILRFEDFAQRGVLDALRTVKPELLDRMVRQYQKDIRAEWSEQ
jgi:hypothetical protein